jgi:hypothetical protein
VTRATAVMTTTRCRPMAATGLRRFTGRVVDFRFINITGDWCFVNMVVIRWIVVMVVAVVWLGRM